MCGFYSLLRSSFVALLLLTSSNVLADTIVYRATASGHNSCGSNPSDEGFFDCNYSKDRAGSCQGLADTASFQSVVPPEWFPLEYNGSACQR